MNKKAQGFLCAIVIILILAVMFYYPAIQWAELKQVTGNAFSGSNPQSYLKNAPVRRWNVVGSYDNSAEAAALLAQANSALIETFRFLKAKYHIDEPDDVAAGHDHTKFASGINHKLRSYVDHLLDNYDPDAIYENNPRYSNDTSYTQNKGMKTFFCLRDKNDPNKLVNLDDLVFVGLHEACHCALLDVWGHGDQFWAGFRWILKNAQESGIYKPVDYSKKPIVYCGLKVAYNPLFDKSLPDWE